MVGPCNSLVVRAISRLAVVAIAASFAATGAAAQSQHDRDGQGDGPGPSNFNRPVDPGVRRPARRRWAAIGHGHRLSEFLHGCPRPIPGGRFRLRDDHE